MISRAALGLVLLAAAQVHADRFNWEGQIEVDAADLRDDDPKKRADAVRKLALDDVRIAQPFLMKALGDSDLSVRHEAAKALGLGGAAIAVPAMIDWLSDSDPTTRAVAAEALGDIGGADATAALIRSLGDTDPMVRQKAVRALGKIGQRGGANVVVALIPRLEDDKGEVRRETVEQLEQLGDKRAVIPLVSRFNDANSDVKKAAIVAVGKLGDQAAVPALVRLMNDSDEAVRTRAVEAIGQLGSPDAIDALIEQLGSGANGDTFHNKVAYALGQIAASPGVGKAGEDAMRVLVESLALNATRTGAREALRVAGAAAIPALVEHLAGHLKGHPETAVALLAEHADSRATAVLAGELERGRVATPLVLKALGATHDPDALVPVLAQVASKDPAIRIAAMEALRPLLGSDARAGDVLIEHLSDDDLEVRVLAAEYLGDLHVATAAPKLAALAGPGNPNRLRTASIDALGELGPKAAPVASKVLVDVLREGPAELHFHAATALANLGDASSVPALVELARNDRSETRAEIVRAIGGSMRDHGDPNGEKLLRELASDGDVKVAIAAICGLAAAKNPADAPTLRELAHGGAGDRQRAAAWALGEIHDPGAFDVLTGALALHDDRLVGDAAWALGELASSRPTDAHVAPLAERWLYLGRHGSWAAAIDSTAALARTLWALPRDARAKLVAGDRHTVLVGLASHKSRLVRINVADALAALGPDDTAAIKTLIALAASDPSTHVRAAAATALGHAAEVARTPAITAALDTAAKDPAPGVAAAARAAQVPGPHAIPARSEWRTFYVVDPSADDARVREQPYFIDGPDGLVWATYTDPRGEITSEHVPAGVDGPNVWAASREPEY
ncbi:MAG TPA: HEAT repeat domain-containing protein [Kofleriaceae bacterium]